MSLRDVVSNCPATNNHTHPLLKEECRRNFPSAGVISEAQPDARDHPEQLDKHRSQLPDHCGWSERRQGEMEFIDEEPHALVVGSGHGGIHVAARLEHLGVPTLVEEGNTTIWDNCQWRNRYDTLRSHGTVRRFWDSSDPPPFLPALIWYLSQRAQPIPIYTFPSVWPTFTLCKKVCRGRLKDPVRADTRRQLGEWFEFHVSALKLDAWTPPEVVLVEKHFQSNGWRVYVRRTTPNVTEKESRLAHVIFALGIEVMPRILHHSILPQAVF